MKRRELKKLKRIIAEPKRIDHCIYSRELKLKIYSISTKEKGEIDRDMITLKQIAPKVDPQSGVGVVIASPSFLEDYGRFYSINMWKIDSDTGEFYHVFDNNLFARKIDSSIEQFSKSSDNMCTLELQIMGEEAKLWNKVVLGLMSIKEYLGNFGYSEMLSGFY